MYDTTKTHALVYHTIRLVPSLAVIVHPRSPVLSQVPNDGFLSSASQLRWLEV